MQMHAWSIEKKFGGRPSTLPPTVPTLDWGADCIISFTFYDEAAITALRSAERRRDLEALRAAIDAGKTAGLPFAE